MEEIGPITIACAYFEEFTGGKLFDGVCSCFGRNGEGVIAGSLVADRVEVAHHTFGQAGI